MYGITSKNSPETIGTVYQNVTASYIRLPQNIAINNGSN